MSDAAAAAAGAAELRRGNERAASESAKENRIVTGDRNVSGKGRRTVVGDAREGCTRIKRI